ncbi:hypothetical protein [Ancylobacter terrae]|uniref:hypothetical protein n=1 Tax=Ancylobacter sp. sgz301288 TaxID=3342077 RepID=UPI00385EE8D0
MILPRAAGTALIAILLAGVAASGALAQTKTPAAPAKNTAPEPVDPAKDPFCRAMGAGFQRLAGTQTCVKISGNVQMEGYAQSYDAAPGSLTAPALRSR